MTAFYDREFALTGDGEPEQVSAELTTPELFRVLGVQPILGRTLSEEDARPNTANVAVLSYGLWQRRYGADPRVIGKQLTLNGVPVTVIGVLPQDFQWNIKTTANTAKPPELWTVLAMPQRGSLHGADLSV